MTTRDGRPSVPCRLRALERRCADALRPGCPHCREGYGVKVYVVDHDEALPPFEARCHVCGRAFDSSEGIKMIIRGIAPDELAAMQAGRAAALAGIRDRGVPALEGSHS